METVLEEGRSLAHAGLQIRGSETRENVVSYTASKWVSAKCSPVVACFDMLADVFPGNYSGGDGEAVSERFCCCEDVWVCRSFCWGGRSRSEGRVGVGPESTRAGKAALDFIKDQNCTDFVAAVTEGGEEFGR